MAQGWTAQPSTPSRAVSSYRTDALYGVFSILRPNAYGGANIHTVPVEAKMLADTLKRTPGSLTSKMLNLQGARENGAADEPALYRVLSEPGKLAPIHNLVITAARAEGFAADKVPDVLTGRMKT
jgi:putative restriction endonuclease